MEAQLEIVFPPFKQKISTTAYNSIIDNPSKNYKQSSLNKNNKKLSREKIGESRSEKSTSKNPEKTSLDTKTKTSINTNNTVYNNAASKSPVLPT